MPKDKESTKENMDLQNITRKKPNPSPGLEPKTTKHTVKKNLELITVSRSTKADMKPRKLSRAISLTNASKGKGQ